MSVTLLPRVAALEGYRSWLRAKALSQNTIAQRLRYFRKLEADFGTPIHQVDAEALGAYLGSLDGWTRATYHNHLASYFDYAVTEGLVEENPIRAMKRPVQPEADPRPLTDDDVSRLLLVARGDVRAFLLLALLAGLRRHEIAKLRGEDFDSNGLHVLGKGGRVDRLPLNDELRELATHYPSTGYWFPDGHGGHVSADAVGVRVSSLFHALEIDRGVHRLRATFGTRLVRAGWPLHVVQKLLRHRALSSTQHYLGTDADELSRAIGSLSSD